MATSFFKSVSSRTARTCPFVTLSPSFTGISSTSAWRLDTTSTLSVPETGPLTESRFWSSFLTGVTVAAVGRLGSLPPRTFTAPMPRTARTAAARRNFFFPRFFFPAFFPPVPFIISSSCRSKAASPSPRAHSFPVPGPVLFLPFHSFCRRVSCLYVLPPRCSLFLSFSVSFSITRELFYSYAFSFQFLSKFLRFCVKARAKFHNGTRIR